MKQLITICILMSGVCAFPGINFVKNWSFEQNNGKVPSFWGRLGLTEDQYSMVDSTTAADGKFSYRLGGLPQKKYSSISQQVGELASLDSIKKPLKLSVWMKTKDIETGPGKGNAVFSFWTHRGGGGNAVALPIAQATGTTDWKEYSITVTPEMIKKIQQGKTGEERPATWTLRANLWSQSGTMWIDKVQCEEIEPPPVSCKMDAMEYMSSLNKARVSIELTPPTHGESLKLVILKDDKSLCSEDKKINGGKLDTEINISGLRPGKYELEIQLISANGKISAKNRTVFSIVEDPFGN
ncbi:MAG: hypothetical protein ACYC4Q_03640 [Victivallaceae bacterium]